jgi:hypothetical protein
MSRMGAAMPQVAYVGITPMREVPRPISTMVTRKVYFRPKVSPKRPKMSAPSGRTANPAANANNVNTNAAEGLTPEKNLVAKIVLSVPYTKKSYLNDTM